MKIRPLSITDYDVVTSLFQGTEGLTFREADSKQATQRYLERNPGLSFVAIVENEIIGCVMAGHDGRRGYLQHLVVLPPYRSKGIARELVSAALSALSEIGIHKTHCFAFVDNALAHRFWKQMGWERRDQTVMYSYNMSDDPNI